MDNFFDNIAIPSLYTGFIFALIGSLLYYSPPSEINGVIGYRTKRSMKSQERWDFSQKYSSGIMGYCGLGMVVLSFLSYFIPVPVAWKQIGGLCLLLACAAGMIVATERALIKKFKD